MGIPLVFPLAKIQIETAPKAAPPYILCPKHVEMGNGEQRDCCMKNWTRFTGLCFTCNYFPIMFSSCCHIPAMLRVVLSPTVERGGSRRARFVILQTKLKDWNWCQGGTKFNNRTKQNTAILCGHMDSEVKDCILTNYMELSGTLPWIFYILQSWYCAAWPEINSSTNYSVKMNACCWWIPWLLNP